MDLEHLSDVEVLSARLGGMHLGIQTSKMLPPRRLGSVGVIGPCRVVLVGEICGGKGGLKSQLRAAGRKGLARPVSSFGLCRDLSGRRLRDVNAAMRLKAASGGGERDGVGLEDVGKDGIRGWHLGVPSWAASSVAGLRRESKEIERDLKRARREEEKKRDEERTKREKKERSVVERHISLPQVGGGAIADAILQGQKARERRGGGEEDGKESEGEVLVVDLEGKRRGWVGLDRKEWLEGVGCEVGLEFAPAHTWVGDGGGGDVGWSVGEVEGKGNFDSVKVAGRGYIGSVGEWGYEVKVVSGGGAQVGWAGKGFVPNTEEGDGVGDDAVSWGWDGEKGVVWWNGEQVVKETVVWKEGDVVGCVLRVEGREGSEIEGVMEWWLNGSTLVARLEHIKLKEHGGVLPALSLNSGEVIQINISGPFLHFNPTPTSSSSSSASSSHPTPFPVLHAISSTPIALHPTSSSKEELNEEGSGDVMLGKKRRRDEVVEVEMHTSSTSTKEPIPSAPEADGGSGEGEEIAGLNLDEYGSEEELTKADPEALKKELMKRGLKCGGTVAERAKRLWIIKSLPPDTPIPKKLLAKKKRKE